MCICHTLWFPPLRSPKTGGHYRSLVVTRRQANDRGRFSSFPGFFGNLNTLLVANKKACENHPPTNEGNADKEACFSRFLLQIFKGNPPKLFLFLIPPKPGFLGIFRDF